MTTLQYHFNTGEHVTFHDFTIDVRGVVTNTITGNVMIQSKTKTGYYRVNVLHEGKPRVIRVARAIASTFIGPPPTLQHTADHDDRNRGNDTLDNIRWKCRSSQSKNRDMPIDLRTAFIIVKDGVEHTAKEWVGVYKKPNGDKYTFGTISRFARKQKYGFRYKVFQNLRAEVWKAVPGSKTSQGEWFISTKNRMKYKTQHAENIMTTEQLHKNDGYPTVKINNKIFKCHMLSLMTFRPREYAAKLPGDMILHKKDDRLDFNPFRLRWGTSPENRIDAFNNGKLDGTKSAQKPVVSYINGIFEQKHDSINAAVRYLKISGYPKAVDSGIRDSLKNDGTRYNRTWKVV
ncbi:hypothetical protein ATCVMN08101_602L [Acanthocystis turfacea Chlorella virus MN0810.1]|nr:hypothetical protein ATCVMN08101_602L [Acanthocystis turfacea Chlorella virus MN0810.1]